MGGVFIIPLNPVGEGLLCMRIFCVSIENALELHSKNNFRNVIKVICVVN